MRRFDRAIAVPLLLTLAFASIGAACSVADNSKAERISPPGGLDDTLPSTSTTVPDTEVTDTTDPQTATTLVQTEQVRLYFITGGQLVYLNLPLPSPVALPVIMSALQFGPPEGAMGTGLRSAISELALPVVTTDGSGVAVVDLPDNFFDVVPVADHRLAVAQLVLTLTSSRGIGQVLFDQPVLKPNGELTPAGVPLAFRDYESLTDANTTVG